MREITQHFEARTAELEDRHRRDAMTGVFNRGHLDRVLEAEFHSASAGGWPLSIVFADLDHFKRVNDTYGHPAGDAVLTATANIILGVVRDTDCVARYGGEEFIIILPGLGADGAKRIAERLLNQLRSFHHPVAGGTLTNDGIARSRNAAPGLAIRQCGSTTRSGRPLCLRREKAGTRQTRGLRRTRTRDGGERPPLERRRRAFSECRDLAQ